MAFRDWFVDYYYLLKGELAFRRRPPKHFREFTKESKMPVILLPGLLLKWHFLRHIGNQISQAGHPVYVVFDLGRNLFSVAWSAELVRNFIDEHDLHQVVIIGHSKGGLIGKQLLAFHNQDRRISAVVAIAAPFAGSKLAGIIPHKAVREMTASSKSINNLRHETHVNNHIFSLIPKYDNHIWADTGSRLEGATNITLPVRGHHRVVFDKEAEENVLDILEKLSKGNG